MVKVFEDKMMDIIKHSVEICFDNVKDVQNLEKVFVMLWKEKSVSSTMYSYQISQKWVKKHTVSEYATQMMSITLDELQLDLDKLEKLFSENERAFPTVFKLIYYPQSSKFNMNLEYEMITERTGEVITSYFDSWVQENIGE